ncbi:MAG: PilW family protein [Gammaproteobacteria bacterium]|nr:PilW family protein [Gammaproteobacteria bacterium]MBP9729087.1 PilW family protein [Gammaproteobacteria bacterium]
MRLNKGFSLLSLIVGVATSSLLLLTITQLSSISRANFSKNEKMIQIYVDARNAIDILRKYVPMAGVGIQQPSSAPVIPIQYAANTSFTAPNTAVAGAAVLRDWVYVGTYSGITGGAPSYTYNAPSAGLSVPLYCANTITTNQPSSHFMGLLPDLTIPLQHKCYYGTNPGWTPVQSSTYSRGYCCNSSGTCTAPIYSCGASNASSQWAASVYQKLVSHISGTVGTGTNSDSLRVYFSNRGPTKMKSYDGTDLNVDTNKPPLTLYNYTFQVDPASATLQMVDAGSGKTYNIAKNVEYMAVLVGESNRIATNTVTPNQPMELPEMNRYVRFNTGNLYPYRITAVRVALVVRSEDNVLATTPATPTTLNLMKGNNNVMITYTPPAPDRRLRKVFLTTIHLNAYALPEYRMHCSPVTVGGNYKLKIGGIPFVSTAWTTNDQCCASTCTSFPSFSACETQRMTGGC